MRILLILSYMFNLAVAGLNMTTLYYNADIDGLTCAFGETVFSFKSQSVICCCFLCVIKGNCKSVFFKKGKKVCTGCSVPYTSSSGLPKDDTTTFYSEVSIMTDDSDGERMSSVSEQTTTSMTESTTVPVTTPMSEQTALPSNYFRGSYYFFLWGITFHHPAPDCDGEGYPVDIETVEENAFVQKLIAEAATDFNATRLDAMVDITGALQRVNRANNFTNWADGYPRADFIAVERCVCMRTDGFWVTMHCHNPIPVVCKTN